MRDPRRLRLSGPARLVQAVAALVALLALTAGVPAALYAVAGSPLPTRLPSTVEIGNALSRPDDGTLLVAALTLITWVAWGCFTWTVVTELAARIRGRGGVRSPRGATGPMRRVAAGLVASAFFTAGSPAVAALAVPPPVVGAAAPLHPLTPTGTAADDHHPDVLTTLTVGDPVRSQPERHGDSRKRTYVVRRYDTLSKIAQRRLGSASRWPKIWRLNAHRRQADGRTFRSPHRIYPGWRLLLPIQTARDNDRRHTPAGSAAPEREPRPAAAPQRLVIRPSAATFPASPQTRSADGADAPVSGEAAPLRSHDPVARAVITIELPSGSIVGLAFAAGVSSALAAARLRRRKRRVIPPPSSGVTVTPEPDVAECVTTMHRAHVKNAYTDQGEQSPTDAELVREAFDIEVPTTAAIGRHDDDTAADVALHGLNLALAGPGADDAARAIVLDLLTRADNYRSQIIIAAHDAEALLGPIVHDQDIVDGKLPGLSVMATRDDAFQRFENECGARADTIAAQDAKDVRELLAADPGEIFPTVLLVLRAGPPAPVPSDILARCGLGVLVLGDEGAATICHVQADGQVNEVSGPLAPSLNGARLFQVSQDDAPEILRIFANSAGCEDAAQHTGPEPEPKPQAAPPTAPPRRTSEQPSPPVRLLILGTPVIEMDGRTISLGRRTKALELLIYLAIHWEGVTKEELCATLWPDFVSNDRFHSMLRHLRDPLRHATGLGKALFIRAHGDRYRVEEKTVSVDLWDFHRALAATRTVGNDEERLAALLEAAELIRGTLAEGAGYEWIDEQRYPVTRAQIDVLCHGAALTDVNAPEQALDLLERARILDSANEDVYQRIITLQLRLRRPDAARRTARLLRAQLSELGLEPELATEELFASLASAARAQRRGR